MALTTLPCAIALAYDWTDALYVLPSATAIPPAVMTPIVPDVFNSSVSFSDVTTMQSPFTGINSNQEVEQWLHSFNLCTDLKKFSWSAKLGLLQLLMKDNAAIWLQTLPAEDLCTIHHHITAFKKRYAMTRDDKQKKIIEIWSCQPQTHDSSDDYIARMQLAAKQIQIPELYLLDAIVRGLHPSLRTVILQNEATTLETIRHLAKASEAANQPAAMY
jgi:ribosomal protein L32E